MIERDDLDRYHADRMRDPEYRTAYEAIQERDARWVTQPGDDRQHTAGPDCPCGPVDRGNGVWDHR